MKRTLLIAALLCSSLTTAIAAKVPLRVGSYSAALQLSTTVALPVHLDVKQHGKERVLLIHNSSEEIELKLKAKIGDTLIFPFPDFDSELRVVCSKKRAMSGFWVNYNKAGNYRIPFDAKLECNLVTETTAPISFESKYEMYFSPNTPDKEKAIGIFTQNGSTITGTVLTETGDYRFLQGVVSGKNFYLSAFDGTHAFLLSGNMDSEKIEGTFYSGKHYQTQFVGEWNNDAQLRDGDSITQMKEDQHTVQFQLTDINGGAYTFPNAQTKGKVVIIQIMGTWCPNCMDETNFYKELYSDYHDKGLEIISIGYEAAETFAEQAAKIQTLKDRKNLGFTFLVGGKASKDLASEQFKMLNEVISFPTSIYIGRDGQVKRIHTGFNGPGTGSYYEEYVQKTHALIQQLLDQ